MMRLVNVLSLFNSIVISGSQVLKPTVLIYDVIQLLCNQKGEINIVVGSGEKGTKK